MPLYRIGEKSVLFIHIPKTGGTSIESWLCEQGSQALYIPGKPDWLPCPPQHFHASILKQLISEDYVDYAFTITRHPIDRFLSEFFYQIQLSPKKFRPSWHVKKKPVLSARPQELACYFRNWTADVFSRYRANQFAHANHIRLQSHFIDYEKLNVFRFEQSFLEIFKQLSIDLGVNCPSCRVAEKVSKRVSFDMPDRTLEQIESFYEEDFQRLNYSKRTLPKSGETV